MNCIFRSLITLSVIALVSISAVCFSASDQRVALVIGNSAYKNAPLRNPANDATDMATILKKLGFKVTLKNNATRREMQNSIRAFGKELRNGGVGLFYFAGHGVQVDGSNYLIPVKANIEFKADVEYEAVDAGRILSHMEDAGNGINIIILDACRNNPYSRSFRSSVNGLAKMDAPRGSILAYSTAPGSVAADGTGRNGLYTSKLLKYIATPNLRVETIFKKVRIDVVNDSGKKQTPWESSSLMVDFYFHSDKTVSSQPARAIGVEKRQSPQNLNAEEEMWKFVQTSTFIEDFTFFLDEYPNSRFSSAAKLKIQQFKRKQNAKQFQASVDSSITNHKKPASIDHSMKLPNNGLRLAFFPSYIIGYRSKYLIIEGLANALEQNPEFKLAFSYYDTKEEYSNQAKIVSKYFTKQNIKNLWLKQKFLSEKIPNEEFIYKLGQQINVDVVLILNIPSLYTGYDCFARFEAYILDIKNQKMISGKNMPECQNETKDITQLIGRTLGEFKKTTFK